jgi:uncharacterized protein YdhG (YjbR/CyaY superfamily)
VSLPSLPPAPYDLGMADTPIDVDGYLAQFPDEVRGILQKVRESVRAAVPGADESISYGIPTFRQDGHLVIYFGGWKTHVGVYPVSRGDEEYETAVGPYRAATDSLHFPYSKPIPYALIERVARAEAGRRRLPAS